MTDRTSSKRASRSSFKQELAEMRREQVSAFDRNSLLWLGLPPSWTEELADFCKFPTRDLLLEEFLDQAERAGFCQREIGSRYDDEEQRHEIRKFWMPEAMRSETLEEISRQGKPGMVAQEATELGYRVWQARDESIYVPPDIARWAELAYQTKAQPEEASHWLQQRIDELLTLKPAPATDDEPDLDPTMVGDTGLALAWVRAANDLALAIRGDLDQAIDLARRRIELAYHQAHDLRYLEKFLKRDEQVEAFEALLDKKSGESWALHYLGMGGVGKTMLMRYINTRLAAKHNLAVARIDFDYLSPEYPAHRPGQLLKEFAEQLRPYLSDPRQERILRKFDDSVDYLHQELDERELGSDPLANIRRQLFGRTLDMFSSILKSLEPQRVVLVLDTVEELVKLRPVGGRLPSVEATFDILEQLHEAVPSMRVIFSGRQRLTRAGRDWWVDVDQLPQQAQELLPKPKPYMRLHIIRGFDKDEGPKFLARFETKQRSLSQDLVKAILNASPDAGTPADIYAGDPQGGERRPFAIPANLYSRIYQALLESGDFDTETAARALFNKAQVASNQSFLVGLADPSDRVVAAIDHLHHRGSQTEKNELLNLLHALGARSDLAEELQSHILRYNPLKLDRYGAWFQDDLGLTAETIRSGKVDPYVEKRIVGRLRADVRTLMPAIVQLRGFDKATLKLALKEEDEFVLTEDEKQAFDETFRTLSSQEWIDSRRNVHTDSIYLYVDPNTYQDLRAYYEREAAAALQKTGRNLALKLERIVRDTPLSRLSVALIDAAVRLLSDQRAFSLWRHIEERIIVEERDWSWTLNVTSRLLFDEWGAASQPRTLRRAAVQAAYAAANLHISRVPSGDWLSVAQTVAEHPGLDSWDQLWLTLRAQAGQIAACRVTGERPSDEQIAALWQAVAVLSDLWRENPDEERQHGKEQLTASVIAALEALLDRAEQTGDRDLVPDPNRVETWAQRDVLSAELQPYASVLAARAFALHGQWTKADEVLASAPTEVQGDVEWPRRQHWFDWQAPDSLRDRVRLECLRLGANVERKTLLDWWNEAFVPPERLGILDSSRLISLVLQRLLASEMVSLRLLWDTATAASLHEVNPEAEALAHRAAPPLFISLALAWLALGDTQSALGTLDVAEQQSKRLAVAVADARAQIARRMRLYDLARSQLARQAHATAFTEAEWWPVAALTGLTTQLVEFSADWPQDRIHAWWRSHQVDLSLQQEKELERFFEGLSEEVKKNVEASRIVDILHLALDSREFNRGRQSSYYPWSSDIFAVERLSGPRTKAAETQLRLALRIWALYNEGGGRLIRDRAKRRVDDTLGAVGKRRAAEIALDEGELLALRLPATAVLLLKLSHKWFLDTGDPVGTTIAAILATIATIRAADDEAANTLLEENVRPAYARLVEEGQAGELPASKDLPTWKELLTLRDELPTEAFSRLEHSSWGNWLHRLFRCLIYQAELATDPVQKIKRNLTEQYIRWLKERYDDIYPLELALTPSTVEKKPGGYTSWLTRLLAFLFPDSLLGRGLLHTSTRWDSLKMWGSVIIYLTIFLALLGGLLAGFKWLVNKFTPLNLGTGSSVALCCGLGIALALLLAGYSLASGPIRHRLARLAEARYEIRTKVFTSTASPTARAVSAMVELCYRRLAFRLSPLFLYWQEVKEDAEVGVSLRDSYAVTAEGIADVLVEKLGSWHKRLGDRLLPIPLQVDPAMALYPFEAILTLAIPKESGGEPFNSPIRFWHAVAGRASIMPTYSPSDAIWLRVVSSGTWRELLASGWRPLLDRTEANTMTYGASLFELFNKQDTPDGKQIIHLVGSMTQTSAGLEMEIERERLEATKQRTLSARPSSVASDQVPVSDAALIVLQAEPVSMFQRQEADREDSAFLRAFASELIVAGAYAVIVLPTMTPSLSVQVLTALSKQLPDHGVFETKTLLKAVNEMRQAIQAWYKQHSPDARDRATPAELQMELALDVALFMGQSER